MPRDPPICLSRPWLCRIWRWLQKASEGRGLTNYWANQRWFLSRWITWRKHADFLFKTTAVGASTPHDLARLISYVCRFKDLSILNGHFTRENRPFGRTTSASTLWRNVLQPDIESCVNPGPSVRTLIAGSIIDWSRPLPVRSSAASFGAFSTCLI